MELFKTSTSVGLDNCDLLRSPQVQKVFWKLCINLQEKKLAKRLLRQTFQNRVSFAFSNTLIGKVLFQHSSMLKMKMTLRAVWWGFENFRADEFGPFGVHQTLQNWNFFYRTPKWYLFSRIIDIAESDESSLWKRMSPNIKWRDLWCLHSIGPSCPQCLDYELA